jgi:hypothetical protein
MLSTCNSEEKSIFLVLYIQLETMVNLSRIFKQFSFDTCIILFSSIKQYISVLNFMMNDIVNTNTSSLWLIGCVYVKFCVLSYLGTRWKWCQVIGRRTPDTWKRSAEWSTHMTFKEFIQNCSRRTWILVIFCEHENEISGSIKGREFLINSEAIIVSRNLALEDLWVKLKC